MIISKFLYKEQPKIRLHHPFSFGDMEKLRKIKGFSYTKTYRYWYLPYTQKSVESLQENFSDLLIKGLKELLPVQIEETHKAKASEDKKQVPENPSKAIKFKEKEILRKAKRKIENKEKLLRKAKSTIENNEKLLRKAKSKIENNEKLLRKAKITIDKVNLKIELSLNTDTCVFEKLNAIEKAFRFKHYSKWFFYGSNENYLRIITILKHENFKYRVLYKTDLLEKERIPAVRSFIEALKVKNYSKLTIESYTPYFKKFVKHFANKQLEEIGYFTLRNYIENEIEHNNLGESQTIHLISAIKFYYEKLLGWKKLYFKLTKSYSLFYIPNSSDFNLISDEIEKLIDYKEKLLLLLRFGFGMDTLQISEMKMSDLKTYIFDKLEQKCFFAEKLKKYSIENYIENKPKLYVFEYHGRKYSENQINKAIYQTIENNSLVQIIRLEYKNIMQQSNFSPPTIKNYSSSFISFLKYFNFTHPMNISDLQIRKYLFFCIERKKLSSSYVNNQINTIKFYYLNLLSRKIGKEFLLRPRKEKKLPVVLSTQEVQDMIRLTKNLKHRTIIALLYSSGLRRSELLNLKVSDIDFKRNVITIRQGKGKKDRQSLLANNIKLIFEEYISKYPSKIYLFEGQTGGKYSGTSLGNIVKQASKRANINKHVTPHVLRHSFATHLLESAVDIRFIQELLGHNSIKTTQRYTHVANTSQQQIISPLDRLDIGDADMLNCKKK